jgi:hypothetical protein
VKETPSSEIDASENERHRWLENLTSKGEHIPDRQHETSTSTGTASRVSNRNRYNNLSALAECSDIEPPSQAWSELQ